MGMDQHLLAFSRAHSPVANTEFMDGLAAHQMENGYELIDRIFRVVAADFPPCVLYDGYSFCAPEEELREEAPVKVNGKPTVDIAQSDIFLMRFHFSYKKGPEFEKEPVEPVRLFMPKAGPAGSLMLSGSRYFISPVLSDVVLSYDRDRIFVQFRRAKFHIGYATHSAVIDGVRTDTSLAWSVLYHMKSAQQKESRKVALMHYLLGHCGFKETFRRYARCTPIISDLPLSLDQYPKDQWVHVQSANPLTKPFSGGSPLCMVIPRMEYLANKDMINNMITALYFIMDRFRLYIRSEHIENLDMWRMTLGMILWEDSKRQGIILEDINKHFDSLDRYVDDMVAPMLKRINMPSANLYEFLAQCMEQIDSWYEEKQQRSSDLYRKELTVNNHVFSEYNDTIFKFFFELINEHHKNGITKESLTKILRDKIKPRMVFKIRNPSLCTNSSTMSYSGDHKFFKLTSILVPQTSSGASKDSSSIAASNLHISVAGVGSYLNLSKTDPTGEARGNPFIHLEEMERIVRNPDNLALELDTQARLDKTRIPGSSASAPVEVISLDMLREIGQDGD